MTTDERIDAIGEAVYGRHKRGFILWPLVDGPMIKGRLRKLIEQEAPSSGGVTSGEVEHIGWAVQDSDGSWSVKAGKQMPTGIRLTLLQPVYVRAAALSSLHAQPGGGRMDRSAAIAELWQELGATTRAGALERIKDLRQLSVPVHPTGTEPSDRLGVTELYLDEGSWARIIGTNGKAAGWIDTHALLAHRFYRDRLIK